MPRLALTPLGLGNYEIRQNIGRDGAAEFVCSECQGVCPARSDPAVDASLEWRHLAGRYWRADGTHQRISLKRARGDLWF